MKAPVHRHHTRWCSHRNEFWKGKWIRAGVPLDFAGQVVAVQEVDVGGFKGFRVLLRNAEQVRLQKSIVRTEKMPWTIPNLGMIGHHEILVHDTSTLVMLTDEEIVVEKMIREL